MSLIFSILILAGVIWLMRKLFEDPETNKANMFSQIKALQQRVGLLEYEVKKLKGEPYPQVSRDKIIEAYTKTEEVKHIEPESIKKEVETEAVKQEVLPKISVKEELSKPKTEKVEFESFITGNVLNKIGAFALIIGMGFFLKYAFDNHWISPTVQILIGFLVAISMLFGAYKANQDDKYKIFAQGLAGAGIAISYLTIFAGYNYYQLYSYPVVFALMSITTLISFQQSLLYNSIATASLGIIGGFLTPFLISGHDNNAVGIFTYIIFLNTWIAALYYKKPNWWGIECLGLFGSYISYYLLRSENYSMSLLSSVLFLTTIWGLYFWLDISKINKKIKQFTFEGNALNILNGFLYYISIRSLFINDTNGLIIATLLIALIYLFSGIIIYYKNDKLDHYLKQNFIIFLVLLAIETNLATAGLLKPFVFALEAFMLIYFGKELEKTYIWKSSVGLFSLSYLTLLCRPEIYSLASPDSFIPILNFRDLTFIFIIGLTFISTKMLEKVKNAEGVISFYRCSWVTILFMLLSLNINDLMLKFNSYAQSQAASQLINFNKWMIQVIVWSLYSTRLLSVGLTKKIQPFTILGSIGTTIALLTLFSRGAVFSPLDLYIPVFNLRFVTFVLSAANLMYIVNLLKKHNISKDTQTLLTYTWGILLFLLVTFEIKDYSNDLDNIMQLILSIGWLAYSVVAMYFGILKRIKPLRYISLIVLGLTIIKVFIYDLSFLDQLARIISFIGLGGILLLVSFFYQKYSEQIKKLIHEDITIETK